MSSNNPEYDYGTTEVEIKHLTQQILNNLTSINNPVLNAINNSITNTVNKLSSVETATVKILSNTNELVDNMDRGIDEEMSNLMNQIISKLGETGDKISQRIDALSGNLNNSMQDISNSVKGVGLNLGEGIQTMLDSYITSLDKTISILKDDIVNTMVYMSATIGVVIQNITTVVNQMFNSNAEFINRVAQTISSNISSLMNQDGYNLGSTYDDVRNDLSAATNITPENVQNTILDMFTNYDKVYETMRLQRGNQV